MIYFLIVFVIFLIWGYLYAPFPNWSIYLLLWKNVLFNYAEPMPFATRAKQAIFLLRYGFSTPFFTFLWYLDDLLYPYQQQVINPIFIIGSPRSGTTFLHRMLMADEKTFFAIRHIEWRYPFITIQKLISFFKLEEKIKKMNYWPNTEAGLKAAQMHKETLYDWEEDAIFFEECFLKHFYILLRFPYRNLLAKLDDFKSFSPKQQQQLTLRHKQVIQKIQYLRGGNKIFLSKEVASHTKLDLLIQFYPQAKFIITLRPSHEFLSSILELIRLSTLTKTNVDVFLIEGFKLFYVERMRNEYSVLLNFLKLQTPQQKVYVTYRQLTTQPKKIVSSIYRQFNIELASEFADFLDKQDKQQQNLKKDYDYQKDFYPGFEEFDKLVAKVDQEDTTL